jgi:uncharacterized membrane protein YcaP (DUF421 family)
MLRDAMRRERVSERQLRSKLRGQGCAQLEGIGAVVLETSGAFAVLGHDAPLCQTLLQDIPRPASPPGTAD